MRRPQDSASEATRRPWGGAGVHRGRRAGQQHPGVELARHQDHLLGDVDLVAVQVVGEVLEVAQLGRRCARRPAPA